MKLKPIFTLIIIAFLSQPVFAEVYTCQNPDSDVTVNLDSRNRTLKIGETSYELLEPTPGAADLGQTKPFRTDKFGLVYITVGNSPGQHGNITIKQLQAESNVELTSFDVKCQATGL